MERIQGTFRGDQHIFDPHEMSREMLRYIHYLSLDKKNNIIHFLNLSYISNCMSYFDLADLCGRGVWVGERLESAGEYVISKSLGPCYL
jgi:hypothetical protein